MAAATIGIIDYGMGNLRSVQKALEQLGAVAVILPAPSGGSTSSGRPGVPDTAGPAIENIDKLILPGVGAFADGMEQLRQRGWIEPMRRFIAAGKPFLGICLGMQLLFEGSEEDAAPGGALVPGLAFLPGKVVRFRPPADGSRLKVPHMGWNTIRWQRDDPLLRGLPQDAAVYFVHSYFAQPLEKPGDPIACATAEYGGRFCATLWHDRIWATQFHPEKSQTVGLKILENFVRL